MKNLFFVTVATSIFSGTAISVKAQKSVNNIRLTDGLSVKRSPAFIEGIEMNPGSTASLTDIIATPVKSSFIDSKNTNPAINSTIENFSSLQFKYALLMNREVETISDLTLYSFIDEWWGTHYHLGGTNRNGIDCSAFTCTLMSRVYGLESPRTARDQYEVCEKISRTDLKEGDLVFFKIHGRRISHVGIYLGNGYFTHSSVSSGVTINNLDEFYYNSKFITGGRIKPVCSL